MREKCNESTENVLPQPYHKIDCFNIFLLLSVNIEHRYFPFNRSHTLTIRFSTHANQLCIPMERDERMQARKINRKKKSYIKLSLIACQEEKQQSVQPRFHETGDRTRNISIGIFTTYTYDPWCDLMELVKINQIGRRVYAFLNITRGQIRCLWKWNWRHHRTDNADSHNLTLK